jgi:hypothetical protein
MEENFTHTKNDTDRKSQIISMVRQVSSQPNHVEVLDGGNSRQSQGKYEINVHEAYASGDPQHVLDIPSSPNQGIELSERINYESNQHRQPYYAADGTEGH